MLRKLIKYELKSSGKISLLLNGYIIVLTILGILMAKTGFFTAMQESDSAIQQTLASTSIITYVVSIIAVSLAITIYQLYRFYKNFYTDEGYLMHTLPVTPVQLILSKGIIAFLTVLLTGLVMMVSIFSITLSAAPPGEWTDFFRQLRNILPEVTRELGISPTVLILYMFVSMILTGAHSVLAFYAALSIGQLFSKHKIMGSIIAYGILNTVEQSISLFFMALSGFFSNIDITTNPPTFVLRTFIFSALFTLIMCILFWIVTHYIMKKKLNLE